MTSKLFLLTTPKVTGHLLPVLALAPELVRRGHRVLVHTAESARPAVEAAGGTLITSPDYDTTDIFGYMAAVAAGPPAPRPPWLPHHLEHRFRYVARRLQFRGALFEVTSRRAHELKAIIERERPDVLVAESAAFGARYAAELTGLPFATIACDPTGALNAKGTLAFPPDPRMAAIPPVLWRAAVDTALPLGRLRRRFGLAPQSQTAELYSLMISDRLHIVLAPREMLRFAPPAGHIFVGPMAFDWRPPGAGTTRPSIPTGSILVSGTTIGRADATETFRRTVRAVAAAGFPTVVITGGIGMPDGLGPHVRLLNEFVAHDDVIPSVRAIVTHGGWGLVGRALRAAVPLLIVPAFGPQPIIAARLAELGLGRHLPAKNVNATTIRHELTTLLDDKPTYHRLLAMRAHLDTLDSPAMAADALEKLCGIAPAAKDGKAPGALLA